MTAPRRRPDRLRRGLAASFAAVLAAAALSVAGPGLAGRDVSGDDEAVVAALRDLEASQVDRAVAGLARLEEEGAAGPAVDLVRSRVAFHQGRYADARRAMDAVPAGSLGPGWEEYRRLVADTERVTAGFVEARSAHFRLRYRPGPDAVLPALALPALERVRETVGEALGSFPEQPVIVDVLPTGSAFVAASGIGRQAVETTGTIALCKWDRILITSPRAVGRGYPWLDTLNHEYVHLLVTRLSANRVPVWLHEGLAHFLENRWRGGQPGELGPYEQTLLARAVKSGEFVTFEQMHPSMAYLPSAEASTLAFAEVATAVHHLARTVGMAGLQRIIEATGRGGDAARAIEEVTGQPFARFEDDWKAFLSGLGLEEVAAVGLLKTRVSDAAVQDDPEDPGASREDDILAGDRSRLDFARLGDLLRLRGRHRAALIEYRKAETAAPLHSPALANKIARALLDSARPSEARDTLARSVALYPHYTATRVALGEAWLALHDLASARRELESSLHLNPFDPRVRSWLARIYGEQGEEGLRKREDDALATLAGARTPR